MNRQTLHINASLLPLLLLAPALASAEIILTGQTYLYSMSLAQASYDGQLKFGPQVEQRETYFAGGPRSVDSASSVTLGASTVNLTSAAAGGSTIVQGSSFAADAEMSATTEILGAGFAIGGASSEFSISISTENETRSVWFWLDYELANATLTLREYLTFDTIFSTAGAAPSSKLFLLEPANIYTLIVGASAPYYLTSNVLEAGYHIDGRLAPVPLPAALWPLVSGLMLLIGVGRKRRTQA